MHRFRFRYNKMGYGDLLLCNDDVFCISYSARTGSCNSFGKLVNALEPGEWTISNKFPPVNTSEKGMFFELGNGWKCRLLKNGLFTHYLIHPDGNKPGTKGCIGLQRSQTDPDSLKLKARISSILETQGEIPVMVEREEEMNPNFDPKITASKGVTTGTTTALVTAFVAYMVKIIPLDLNAEAETGLIAGGTAVICGLLKMLGNWKKNK